VSRRRRVPTGTPGRPGPGRDACARGWRPGGRSSVGLRGVWGGPVEPDPRDSVSRRRALPATRSLRGSAADTVHPPPPPCRLARCRLRAIRLVPARIGGGGRRVAGPVVVGGWLWGRWDPPTHRRSVTPNP